MITFDPVKKKKRDPNALPESMVEKYGSEIKLSKREQRRLHHSQKKAIRDSDPNQAAAHENEEETKAFKAATEETKVNKWEEIYGASGKVNDLILKQAHVVEKKKKKKQKGK